MFGPQDSVHPKAPTDLSLKQVRKQQNQQSSTGSLPNLTDKETPIVRNIMLAAFAGTCYHNGSTQL